MTDHVCSPDCPDYCFSCNAHEPLEPTYYRVCGECLHVFRTEADLLLLHNEILDELSVSAVTAVKKVTSGEQVFSCPKCIHDF